MLVDHDDIPLAWRITLQLLGWGYFLAWSASFWPQVILNYRRKSATGLSQDFSILNPLGFLSYLIYNLLFTFSPLIRSQYAARHEGNYPQVSRADIAFSAHAFVLSSISLGQTYWYGRSSRQAGQGTQNRDEQAPLLDSNSSNLTGSDRLQKKKEVATLWTKLSIPAIAVGLAIGGLAVKFGKLQAIDLVYYVSYVKIYISIAKWVPQLVLNHIHRSTSGFSTSVVLLDMVGSIGSFLELVLSSLLVHDPGAIIGNPAKLLLSALTFGFDWVFVGQRYCFYGRRQSETKAQQVEVDEEER